MESRRLQRPYRIATDTWVIPQIEPVGPDRYAAVNSMVITAAEPVIVDTGCAVNRDQWLADVFGIVDPDDVRWVFLTHADRDHIGNLDAVLDACAHATVITTKVGVQYMLADRPPPLARVRWLNDGESFDAGDRRLRALRPPVWDGANTRGLFDPTTGIYWAADSFASLLTHPVTDATELDHEFWVESFLYEHRSYCEWHTLLDPAKFDAHVARTEHLATTVASAHGPVLTGPTVQQAYRLMHQIARMAPVPADDDTVLHDMLATMLEAA